MSIIKKGETSIQETDPYTMFEKLDEDQIAQEVEGIYADTLVYRFEGANGQIVTGLSIKGVFEVAKDMVRRGYDVICEEAKIIEENEQEYKSSCKATYKAPNGNVLSTYGYTKTSKNYGRAPNPFAYVQALSKAQRNALRTLIPERFVTAIIEKFLEEKKGIKHVVAEKVAVQVAVQPIAEEKAVTPAGQLRKYETVRFINSAPRFTGIDNVQYGPFKPEDVANMPKMDAERMMEQKFAVSVFAPSEKREELAETETEPKMDGVLASAKLEKDGKSYGIVKLMDGIIEVDFNPPIPNVPPIDSFLCEKVIDNICRKAESENRKIEYNVVVAEDMVHSIQLAGDVLEKDMRDLVSPCIWTAKTAQEKKA